MKEIFLCLGSNIGDRVRTLQKAGEAIRSLPGTKVVRNSLVYETEPVGLKEQSEFLNVVLEIESDLSPGELLHRLKGIEVGLGRTGTQKWGPREIDIDILYYGSRVVTEEGLRIPHPEIRNRRFVLEPLAALAPSFRDPESHRTIADLLRSSEDESAVRGTEWTIFDSSWEQLSAGRQQRDTTHRD